MTFALQNALLHPERAPGVESSLDFLNRSTCPFPLLATISSPASGLPRNALAHGGTAPLVFNAANEIAVEAFLRNRIGFLQISDIIDHSLSTSSNNQMHSIAELLDLDSQVRQLALCSCPTIGLGRKSVMSLLYDASFIFVALFALGFTIFIHELGHFLAARKRGLVIKRFSIGFGPKIFGWTRNGVEYRLSAIPFGGYVALLSWSTWGD